MLAYFIFIVAITISFTSAYFSILGLTAIFPGAVYTVIVMATVLELGKLTSVMFLHYYWKSVSFIIKTYLVLAIVILMSINSIGIFGGLSKSHIEQQIFNQNQGSQIEIIITKLTYEKSVILDLNNQIQQIDNNINKLTQQGKAATSLVQANQQRKERDNLSTQIGIHQKNIEDLTNKKIVEDTKNKK